ATGQARQAFAPAVAPDIQWGNLLLLAIHQSERLNLPSPLSEKEEENSEEPTGDWRPVLVLNALERETGGVARISAPNMRETVQGVVRPLWRTWKSRRRWDAFCQRRDFSSYRSCVLLMNARYRFCVKHDWFWGGEKLAAEAMHNWADLNAVYVLAIAVCRGVIWQVAFEETQISGNRDLVLSTLFFSLCVDGFEDRTSGV
ncbi:hypothetical protein C0995_010007, partial [Termitomyces sp. Mi166